MASTNYGEQLITFTYGQEAASDTFNRLLYKMLPSGIYDGALLSKSSPTLNRISISPGTFIFNDADYSALTDDSIPETLVDGLSIKVQTTVSITDIEVTNTTPYIVMWFDWQNVSGNYLDYGVVAFSDIEDKHIILGRACFVDGILQTTFDYGRRDEPALISHEDRKNELKVLMDEAGTTTQKGVYVNPGSIVINNKRITWAGGYSNELTDTTGISAGESRIDILYLKDDGTIGVLYGSPAVTPSVPQYPKDGAVLAHIEREEGRGTINGNEITNIDFRYNVSNNLLWGDGANEVDSREIPIGSTITQTVTGGTNYSILSTVSIRDAIEDVIENTYNGEGLANDVIQERHIDWGTGVNQVSATDVPYSGDVTGATIKAALDNLYDTKLENTTDTFTGTLTITGDIDISNSLDISGGYTGTGLTIDSSGNISTQGTLTIDGTSTLSGDTTISGTLTLNGYVLSGGKGDFGSISVDTTQGGYYGVSLNGYNVFMANGTLSGIYDDVNNNWIIRGAQGGETKLYHNGVEKLSTRTGGITVTGSIESSGSVSTSGYLYARQFQSQNYDIAVNLDIDSSWVYCRNKGNTVYKGLAVGTVFAYEAVGIHTSNPNYALHVYSGNARIDDHLGVGLNPSGSYSIYAAGASRFGSIETAGDITVEQTIHSSDRGAGHQFASVFAASTGYPGHYYSSSFVVNHPTTIEIYKSSNSSNSYVGIQVLTSQGYSTIQWDRFIGASINPGTYRIWVSTNGALGFTAYCRRIGIFGHHTTS